MKFGLKAGIDYFCNINRTNQDTQLMRAYQTPDEERGLGRDQVLESRRIHGLNELTPPERPALWKLYLEKFRDPVIRILLIAALLSFVVAFVEQDFAETIGIILAILLATGIGFYFEYDAARKFDILNALGSEAAVKTIRDGIVVEVRRKDLVVGDVILLDAGDEVPADAELMKAESLQVNESALTGEPMVHKSADPKDADENAPYPTNHLMRGTTLLEGSAMARVVAVGDHTEIGKVAKESSVQPGEQTPLNKQLYKLAGLINKVGYTVAVLAFLFFTAYGLMRFVPEVTAWTNREYLHVFRLILNNFMMAVTLIVMAVPEGLPMAVTLSLALNMRRMLKTNNLVRKMHACETMGAITTVCTDKTGTLTQNRMTVSQMLTDMTHTERMDEAIACNTTAHLAEGQEGGLGNPTEVALLLWMKEHGGHYAEIRRKTGCLARLPFSSERKYMASVVKSAISGRYTLYIKGAPEVLLEACRLSGTQLQECKERLYDWQHHAQRTLLVAYKELEDDAPGQDCVALVQAGGLTLLGLAAISDPIRPEVPQAVTDCLKAGVDVKIVTGDSTGTVIEIARQIGLWAEGEDDRHCMRGADFARLSDEEALEVVKDLKVMSRARPLDKQRLVRLLQARGEVVAVTGDGTNDAPALNYAQVGLSMGSGTSVAKEASDITLLDDSFGSIVTAIMWGRSLYKNIQRFVMFQLTINFTALLIVLVGAFLGTTLPLTVTQMLWVNIIMDTFAALALASLPAEPGVMAEKPRPADQFIITRPMWASILGYGTAFVVTLLAMLLHAHRTGDTLNLRELTFFFTFFVLLQFWNLLNAKAFSTHQSAFRRLHKCYGVLMVLGLISCGQFLIVQFGGAMFRTVPLGPVEWAVAVAASSVVLWAGECGRFIKRMQMKRRKI